MLPTDYVGRGSPKDPGVSVPFYEGVQYLDVLSGIWWIVENGEWVVM